MRQLKGHNSCIYYILANICNLSDSTRYILLDILFVILRAAKNLRIYAVLKSLAQRFVQDDTFYTVGIIYTYIIIETKILLSANS